MNDEPKPVLLTGDPALHSPDHFELHALLQQELTAAQPLAQTRIVVVFLDAYAEQLPTLITTIQAITKVQITEEQLAESIENFRNEGPIDITVDDNGIPILRLCILDHQPPMLCAAEVSWHGHSLPSQARLIPCGLVEANTAYDKILDFWLTQHDNILIDTVDSKKLPRMATMGAWTAARAITTLAQHGTITNDTWQDLRRTVDLKLIATWGNYVVDEAAAMTIMLYVDKCLAQYDAADGVQKLNEQYKYFAVAGDAGREFFEFFMRQLRNNALPNQERIIQELDGWEKQGMAAPTTDPTITVPLPPQLADLIAINSVVSSAWYTHLTTIYQAGGENSCCLGPVLRAAARLGFAFAKPAEFLGQAASAALIRHFADYRFANSHT